jgi:magnesium-transporting ATPase (P-type)
MIHHYSNQTFTNDGGDDDFSGKDKQSSLRRVDEMAKKGLVPVSYAYKRLLLSDLEYHMESKEIETPAFKEDLLTDLNYLCTFGLENPLRLHVEEDVRLIKYGKKKEDEEQKDGGAPEPTSAAATGG